MPKLLLQVRGKPRSLTQAARCCRGGGVKLFLGGLDWKTTEGWILRISTLTARPPAAADTLRAETVKEHFSQYGEVSEVVSWVLQGASL